MNREYISISDINRIIKITDKKVFDKAITYEKHNSVRWGGKTV